MRIDSISLNNFKCFETFESNFDPNLNVIVGNNGIGKTALLHGLNVALGGYLTGVPNIGVGGRPIYRRDMRITKNKDLYSVKTPVVVTATGKLGEKNIKWTRFKSGPRKGTNKSKAYQIKSISKQHYSDIQNNILIELPIIAFYATSRITMLPKPMPPTIRNIRHRGYHNALDETCNYQDLVKLLKEDTNSNLKKVIKKSIIGCLEGCKDITIHPQVGILIHFENGNTSPLSRMSDGYQTFLAVIGDIARRCHILNPHLDNNANKCHGIVLIDEVDLHLHPSWQSKIVSLLRKIFPNIQFFLTTHSPFVIQNLRKEQLLILDPEIEKGGDPFRKSIEDVLQKEMGVEIEKRSVLFNEMVGVADKYFTLIKEGKSSARNQEVGKLRERLNALEERFGEDPAFVALLQAERKISGI